MKTPRYKGKDEPVCPVCHHRIFHLQFIHPGDRPPQHIHCTGKKKRGFHHYQREQQEQNAPQ